MEIRQQSIDDQFALKLFDEVEVIEDRLEIINVQQNQQEKQEQLIEIQKLSKRQKIKNKRKNKQTFKKLKKLTKSFQSSQEEEREEIDSYSQQAKQNDSSFQEHLSKLKKNSAKCCQKRKKYQIEEKEGFKLEELGNLGNLGNFDEQQSQSQGYSSKDKNRKKCRKKIKKNIITNEQMLNQMKQYGCLQQQQNEQDKEINYDKGIDKLYANKNKLSSYQKGVKISNKLFGDLQSELNQNQIAQLPQLMQLEFGPKNSISSSQPSSFLKKVETIKKKRGLENNEQQQYYDNSIKNNKIKKSMQKLITSLNQNKNQDIDLEIRVPVLSKGKSADIINNTVFIKRTISINQLQINKEIKTNIHQIEKKQRQFKRNELFKMMKQDTITRKSKYISVQEVKNSFKKTDLDQLEKARIMIQEKRNQQIQDQLAEEFQEQEEQQGSINENQLPDGVNQQMGYEELKRLLRIEEGQFEVQSSAKQNQLDEEQNQQNSQFSQDKNHEEESLVNQSEMKVHQQSQNQISDQEQQRDNHDNYKDESNSNFEQQQQKYQSQQNQNNNNEISQKSIKDNKIQQLQQQNNNNRQQQKYKNNHFGDNNDTNIKNNRTKIYQKIQKIQETIELKSEQNINPQIINVNQNQLNEQFQKFRKLRKIATVISQKRKIRQKEMKIAEEYFEHQAELGSDNQEHDEEVKKINYEQQQQEYKNINLDEQLQQLIDNAVDINEQDEEQAFRKYMEDVKRQDRQQIQQILRGEFKKIQKNQIGLNDEAQDQKMRKKRMQQMLQWIKKQDQQQQPYYMNRQQEQQSSIQRSQVKEEEEEDKKNRYEKLENYLTGTTTLKQSIEPINITHFHIPSSVPTAIINTSQNKHFGNSNNAKTANNSQIKRTWSHLNELISKSKNIQQKSLFVKQIKSKKSINK